MMCLGADVELTFVPKHGLQAAEDGMPPLMTLPQSSEASEPVCDDLHAVDAMDTDEEEEMPHSTLHPKVSSALTSGGSSMKRKKDSDILITLVHGDAITLSGDEFDVRQLHLP